MIKCAAEVFRSAVCYQFEARILHLVARGPRDRIVRSIFPILLGSLTGKVPHNFAEAPVLPPAGFAPAPGADNGAAR
jgi:hypothetical protein